MPQIFKETPMVKLFRSLMRAQNLPEYLMTDRRDMLLLGKKRLKRAGINVNKEKAK